jgi:hypothetical protein
VTPLARLVAAVDGYLASKWTEDDQVWVRAFNELLAALREAKEHEDDQARRRIDWQRHHPSTASTIQQVEGEAAP